MDIKRYHFLIRRKMDDVRYAYENGMNVLTIEKVI